MRYIHNHTNKHSIYDGVSMSYNKTQLSRDKLCQSKSFQLLHNRTKNHIWKGNGIAGE